MSWRAVFFLLNIKKLAGQPVSSLRYWEKISSFFLGEYCSQAATNRCYRPHHILSQGQAALSSIQAGFKKGPRVHDYVPNTSLVCVLSSFSSFLLVISIVFFSRGYLLVHLFIPHLSSLLFRIVFWPEISAMPNAQIPPHLPCRQRCASIKPQQLVFK